jgi:hypothetical protein
MEPPTLRPVPIRLSGPVCARRGCSRPEYEGGLCGRCLRLARLFGKEPQLFAHEPLRGWDGEHDAPALPWDRLERELLSPGP